MDSKTLRGYRKQFNLTRKELALSMCVKVRTVISWENNQRHMPLWADKLFCFIYDLPFVEPKSLEEIDSCELHPDLFN